MFKETLGHTRTLQWTWIGVTHWFVFAGFIFLSSLALSAYRLIFDAHQAFSLIATLIIYEWPVELLSWLTLFGIVYLIVVRQNNHPRALGRRSRFFGSTFWQAYFVEAVILSVVLLGIALRTIEYACSMTPGTSKRTQRRPTTTTYCTSRRLPGWVIVC